MMVSWPLFRVKEKEAFFLFLAFFMLLRPSGGWLLSILSSQSSDYYGGTIVKIGPNIVGIDR